MQETRRRILNSLAEGPVSGPAIASDLDISRSAVWKHVESLREAGFDIESHDDGYLLTGIPEFGAAAVEYGLKAPFEIEYHETIGSTNNRARELAGEGATDKVVLADEQTGGRGRLDRPWIAPSGGIWVSILCRPSVPTAHAPVFTLASAVATTDALSSVGIDAGIKWPNDILVDGKKLVGILTEMEGESDRVSWIVVGIGINANFDADLVPETATTVRELVGDVDRAAVTRDLLDRFHELLNDPDQIIPAWRESTVTLGRRVRVETPNGDVVGEAVDIEFPGTLIVETDTGRKRISSGDCEHLRPVR